MIQTKLGAGWHRESKRHSDAAKKGSTKKKGNGVVKSLYDEITELSKQISKIYDTANMMAFYVIEEGGNRAEASEVYKNHIKNAERLEWKREKLRERLWEYQIKVNKSNELRKSEFVQERDRLTQVLDVVRELEREYNAPVLKSEIVEKGKREGLTERQVEESLYRLKMDGQIYDPNRNDRFKVV